jgi:xylan 1,4-beta-xylosidase
MKPYQNSVSTLMRITLMTAAILFILCSSSAIAQLDKPVLGKSLRYCNPLPIEASTQNGSPSGISLGDVTVVEDNGKYYMFCTGGGAWVSEDLVNWKYKAVQGARVPVAPGVFKYNGYFYMSGNSSPLYRSKDILGPYEQVGNWTMMDGKPWTGTSANGRTWDGAFDVEFFEDANKPYLYYPGRGIDGIFVVQLDPKDLSKFATEPKHLFAFDKSHIWERYGEFNEYTEISWIEGPWVIKHNDTFYLQYSASGTQWQTYATGVYTSKNPMGPFTYAPNNPVLRKTTGVVTGAAHGCVVKGLDGNWWQFYTIVLANPPGGRRIGLDPVGFDKDGNMFVHGPTETPQWAPGAAANPAVNNDSGSIPLTVNKISAMNQRGGYSSQRTGRNAAYAIDNSNGTWWEPAEDDNQPSLTIDLGPATEFDKPQLFTIDSCRIEFTTGGGGRGMGGRGTGGRGMGGARGAGNIQPPQQPQQPANTTIAHQYKIEASTDGTNFTMVLDKTKNNVTKYVEFDEIPPTVCRYVRFTMTDWPRQGNSTLGIMEFTVFGKPVE